VHRKNSVRLSKIRLFFKSLKGFYVKILHLGKYYPPFMGGIENFMADLMYQQTTDGHLVSAIVHHHQKQQSFSTEYHNGVTIFRVRYLGQVAYTPLSPSFGYYLNKVVKQQQPDVLHIHLPNVSAFWCLFLPSVRKIPWVIHWHADVIGSVPDTKIKLLYPFYRLFENALLKRAKAIIATSPAYLASSKPLQGFKDKTSVIPLGLVGSNELEHLVVEDKNAPFVKNNDHSEKVSIESNDESDEESNNESNTLCKPLQLLMIGRLTYYKGHGIMLKALAKLKSQGIIPQLTIIGDGELRTAITLQIEQLELTGEVKLVGKLSNIALARQLVNTDLLCLPSIERTESFGVVLLEAMRAGKPCLVSDVEGSGMSWVIKDNHTGFVVKHNNVQSLMAKLNYITANSSLLSIYGKTGQQRFNNQFNIKKVSSLVSKCYEKILNT
jgi:rhamnosyl/mannosyltransferase